MTPPPFDDAATDAPVNDVANDDDDDSWTTTAGSFSLRHIIGDTSDEERPELDQLVEDSVFDQSLDAAGKRSPLAADLRNRA